MVQSPSWEANWFAASQEIPRISRNPKVHYRTHKRPPPVSILGQPNPVHISTWRSSLILSNHLRLCLPSGLLPSGFPTKTLYAPTLLTHTRHMPSPSHSYLYTLGIILNLMISSSLLLLWRYNSDRVLAFSAHVLIIRRSKLHYTASGIVTLKQVSGLKLLKYNSINMSK